MHPWYRLSVEEVLQKLDASPSGLRSGTVSALQEKYGPNALREAPRRSKFAILLSQFKDVMIVILIVAAGVSMVVGEATDSLVILAIIVVNAWIGYRQEYNAEESVRMLQKMAAQTATAIRDGNPVKIDTAELVPGDIVLLEAGDIVPADARLLSAHALKTEEAALTGESVSVTKITDALPEEDLLPGDQKNMVFKGTIVSNGSAKAVVVATGMDTEIGKIAQLMDVEDQKTPLQKRLAVFSKQLTVAVILICLAVFCFGLLRGEEIYIMFLTALSLAVAALPEALPAVITIALAQGARRMVMQNALIRRLPAVETLGSVTYICTDKTGTLTESIMTVEKVIAEPGKEELLLHAMMLNNEVRFSGDGEILGDSTEKALVNYAKGQGLSYESSARQFPFKGKVPFDSDRMMMSTLHESNGEWLLFVKGAPAVIAAALSERHHDKVENWLNKNREWAADGLRVLFFAIRTFSEKPGNLTPELECDLDFLGMVAMIDPPREAVMDAIAECQTAGIRTVMITGDQMLTAKAIARRLGMGDDTLETRTGKDLAKVTWDQFLQKVKDVVVYARVSPEQKLQIVKALQQNNQFVAMTGDGVNDAPSLKQADIGVAMGITGTDVSKEASDMILLDDNFATIVKAVKEGRRIYENIRKFILYVLSCNLAEILTISLAPVLGMPIPLLPIHILWINLVTDGLPGITLTAEPAEPDIMKRPPRPPGENLFAGGMTFDIIIAGIILAAAALHTQYRLAAEGYDIVVQQTAVFTVLCLVQLGNALSVRAVNHPLVGRGMFSNPVMWAVVLFTIGLQAVIVYVPVLHDLFKTTSLEWPVLQWVLITLVVCLVLLEVVRVVRKKRIDRTLKTIA
ncbi:MAG TPA: cation-translocating P-type ATPase [Cyclobacteriaceae bacterium]